MRKNTKIVCCKNFQKMAIQYLDLSISGDETLNMLAELLMCMDDSLPLTGRELMSLSHEISQYLNRKIVLEHCIFNHSLHSCTFDEIDLKLERLRILKKLEK